MKILHIVESLDRSSGGPARSVQGLVIAERQAGLDASVYAIDGSLPWLEGVPHIECNDLSKSGTGVSLSIFNIIHIHGIWSLALHRACVACRNIHLPYIVAPRGMLEPWSLKAKWLKKRIARYLYQDRDLKLAAALHATAVGEAEQFRKLGFKNYSIISPNGVNIPDSSIDIQSGDKSVRRVLFVSRMHPKKGVIELVESWNRVRPQGWVCELVYSISGGCEKDYECRVKSRVKELNLEKDFVFTGVLDDNEKWKAYGRASLFVLPTYSENFGIVVAEALWAKVPVITTKGTPWFELETCGCGCWIELPANDGIYGWPALDRALKKMSELTSEELSEFGRRGHRLVEEKYTWQAVVGTMKQGYEQILCKCSSELPNT